MTPKKTARAKWLRVTIPAAQARVERLREELEELDQLALRDQEQRRREEADARESYGDSASYDHDLEQRWRDTEDNLGGGD